MIGFSIPMTTVSQRIGLVRVGLGTDLFWCMGGRNSP